MGSRAPIFCSGTLSHFHYLCLCLALIILLWARPEPRQGRGPSDLGLPLPICNRPCMLRFHSFYDYYFIVVYSTFSPSIPLLDIWVDSTLLSIGNNAVMNTCVQIQNEAKVSLQFWVHETQSLFLYYYLLVIVLFSIQTTVHILLPQSVSLWDSVFSYFGYIPGSKIAGSHDNFILNR